jgi:site-specific DNA-methyltransferase (adenine-specific)
VERVVYSKKLMFEKMEVSSKIKLQEKLTRVKMSSKNSTLLINNKISARDLLEPFRGVVNILHMSDLNNYDTVAVYDVPAFLPFWFRALKNKGFEFKYHIAVYFDPLEKFVSNNLLVSHVDLLLVSRSFRPNKIRIPHEYCNFCKKPLKDWGGKTHLMHPQGHLISDVWKDMPLTFKDIVEKDIPQLIVERLQQMFGDITIISGEKLVSYNNGQPENYQENQLPRLFRNVVIQGDAIEKLKDIPSNSVDTVFIDPPYNLGKNYISYEDERKDYVEWSLKWLRECFRILKPDGSLFLLNIPKWAHEIAIELIPEYYLIRWIVWDEPAEPRGKLIPAHYSLLWFGKTKNIKTYPLDLSQDSMKYCLRINCTKIRRALRINDKIIPRDVRWDIHRIKHKGKRFKYHPVQLPEKLLEFIIKLTTEEEDVVLDPMCGTGTTLAVSKKLGREYVGIDIDPVYIEITNKRLRGELNEILETPSNHFKNGEYRLTKKWIQIKMGELARRLNRLPTLEEAATYLGVEKEILADIFPNWSKALKLAKIVIDNPSLVKSEHLTSELYFKKDQSNKGFI